MGAKKIVFIVNALHMQRCVKRIDEFVEKGYEVEAYGFNRGVEMKKRPLKCKIEVIGKIDSSTNYLTRLGTIYKGIRRVLQATNGSSALYYVFGLDNAIFFMFQTRKEFIYEESDLVHTYMKSQIAISFFEWIDKKSIKKALLSVFTSEGFIQYHFGDRIPNNAVVIPNRLPVDVQKLEPLKKEKINIEHLSIGFVGFIRFNSIFNFARVFCEKFPKASFHFFGTTNNELDRKLFEPLKQYDNCYFHGAFMHPDDLPKVYSKLDVVLSTYDVENENVRYAEPNKIYEAIYFETPIVVSSGTFLAEKVKRLGIGYDINAMDENEIVEFVNGLTTENLQEKIENARKIDKKETLNINEDFFEKLENLLSRD